MVDVKRGISRALTVYQRVVSPLLGPRCRFYPSCSEYAKVCFDKYSLPVATARTISRICRCHPLNPGGFDLP